MTQLQQDRAKILIKATIDILAKCDSGMYVKNVMEETAFWDDAECDGYCLKEDLKDFIESIES